MSAHACGGQPRVPPGILSEWPRFRAFLEAVRERVPDERALGQFIPLLPPAVLAGLAAGPMPYRYDCRVCSASGGEPFWGTDDNLDPSDALCLVWGFHEVPKLDMARRNDQYYGALANETYRRCLATYRAAGWVGSAPEPNA
jgi:hypothetical protein